MVSLARCLWILVLSACCVSTVWGREWSRLAEVVTEWDGPPIAILDTHGVDPVEVPWGLELIDLLTGHGFEVQVAQPDGGVAREALVFDVRQSNGVLTVVARRSPDQAILGFERRTQPLAVETSPPLAPVSGRGEVSEAPSGGAWKVAGSPLQMVVLQTPADGGIVDLALLGKRLRRVRLDTKGIRELGSWSPPVRPVRGLRLDASDLDGDGVRDLATTWAEDVQILYEGTQSNVHSWVLDGRSLAPLGDDLESYLRLVAGYAWIQKRSEFTPFTGSPTSVAFSREGASLHADTPRSWLAGRNIFEVTPWAEGWVGWRGEGRLAVLDADGNALPGTTISTDFGRWAGPAVSVRLAEPEFRTGFEKEDRVTDRQVFLPRRVLVGRDGALYLIRRVRSGGGFLASRPSGADRVVRVAKRGNALSVDTPFGEEDSFILDFGLLPDGAGVVVLLNDEEDGSGAAFVGVRRPLGRR